MSGSGLRNPGAAARALGSVTLASEGVVLLLAIQPLRVLGDGLDAAGVGVVCGLAVAALALSGLTRRGWAWPAGGVLQVLLLASGVLHWSLAAVGVVFGAVWLYVLRVRRTILTDAGPGGG